MAKEQTAAITKGKSVQSVLTPKASGSGPIRSIAGYFKGAWQELRAVRWPNRRNTWGLTLAVLGFTAFFIVLILLVDAGFQLLFQKVLLKQ